METYPCYLLLEINRILKNLYVPIQTKRNIQLTTKTKLQVALATAAHKWQI